jgi:predicted regulator of Ras-like GTPase activity (Roadblock/LC7/MglB family)
MDKNVFINFLNTFSVLPGMEGILILSPKGEVIYSHFNSITKGSNPTQKISEALTNFKERMGKIDIGQFENMIIQGEKEKLVLYQGSYKNFAVVVKGNEQLDVREVKKTISAFLADLEPGTRIH